MNNDLISRSALKEDIVKLCRQINASNGITVPTLAFTRVIDNAATVSLQDIYQEGYYDGHLEGYTKAINEGGAKMTCKDCIHSGLCYKQNDYENFPDRCGSFIPERPQGEYVDISKLRLMTVEECAGHTIDYAMGWKACIEWIKKGGAKE